MAAGPLDRMRYSAYRMHCAHVQALHIRAKAGSVKSARADIWAKGARAVRFHAVDNHGIHWLLCLTYWGKSRFVPVYGDKLCG